MLENILSGDKLDFYAERAALMQYDGSLDRTTAERRALALVLGNRPELSGRAGHSPAGLLPRAAAITSTLGTPGNPQSKPW